jgi:hypothetical protein
MEIDIVVEGEGLADVATIRLPHGAPGRALVAAVAAQGGFPAEEALLFVEDEDEPLDVTLVVIDERMSERIHHVHRARHIEVTVFYKDAQKSKTFRPATRVQQVLDWAVGPHGFRIDSAIAPEMELALHAQTMALPKNAHIGRFVRHPHHSLALDLIRGVVPNGGGADAR